MNMSLPDSIGMPGETLGDAANLCMLHAGKPLGLETSYRGGAATSAVIPENARKPRWFVNRKERRDRKDPIPAWSLRSLRSLRLISDVFILVAALPRQEICGLSS